MSNSGLLELDDGRLLIWIEKTILGFNLESNSIEFQHSVGGSIIDLKVWNEKIVLIAEKELSVLDFSGTEFQKFDLVRRPTSLQIYQDEAFVADRSGDVYQFNLTNGKKSPETKTEPILGHCSNLLKIEIDSQFIYTGEQDEKVRISWRKHPYVIESYLLGHSEFISDFKLTKEKNLFYSTSGDGTCIQWKDGSIRAQTETAIDSIAHSLTLSPTNQVTFALQNYVNPLDASKSEEIDDKVGLICFYDSDLNFKKEVKLEKGDYPLASLWTSKCPYWLIEDRNKTVRLGNFGAFVEDSSGQEAKEKILKKFEIISERDPEQFDKLRKIQPKTENYDEYLRRRKEGFKQSRNDNKAKRRKKENSKMITA